MQLLRAGTQRTCAGSRSERRRGCASCARTALTDLHSAHGRRSGPTEARMDCERAERRCRHLHAPSMHLASPAPRAAVSAGMACGHSGPMPWTADSCPSCAKRGAVDRGASRVHLSTGSRCRCSRGNLGSSSPRTRGSRPLATEAGIFWAPAFAGATTTDAAGNVLFLASVSAPLRDAGALEDTWIRHPRERGDPALCRRRPALSRPPSPPARGQPPSRGRRLMGSPHAFCLLAISPERPRCLRRGRR